MIDQELLELNEKGFIPGPNETEENFQKRVSYCQNIQSYLENETPAILPEPPMLKVQARLQDAYGFSLDWTPVLYSNKDLAIWHGGCAWIFQKDLQTPKGAFFQLRKAFSRREFFFGTSKEEILVHESAHVARMDFEEPIYEELLAFKSSAYGYRRYFGPIITKPSEALLFILSLVLPWLLFPYLHEGIEYVPFLIPIILIAMGFFRLFKRHKTLNKTFQVLYSLTGSSKLASHLLFRLTDKEIQEFGNLTLDKLKGIIYSKRYETLRHQLIYAILLKEHKI